MFEMGMMPEGNRILNISGSIPGSVFRDTSEWMEMKGGETVKIRVRGRFENAIDTYRAKMDKKAKLAYLNAKLYTFTKMHESFGKKIESIQSEICGIDSKKQFERKFTDDEIFDMMLRLPKTVKMNPTISAIQIQNPGISRRQAIKVKKHAERRLESIS